MTAMIEPVASDRQRKFGLDKRDTLPQYCRECKGALCLPRWLPAQPLHQNPG
jgi:uncharacterized protein